MLLEGVGLHPGMEWERPGSVGILMGVQLICSMLNAIDIRWWANSMRSRSD